MIRKYYYEYSFGEKLPRSSNIHFPLFFHIKIRHKTETEFFFLINPRANNVSSFSFVLTGNRKQETVWVIRGNMSSVVAISNFDETKELRMRI